MHRALARIPRPCRTVGLALIAAAIPLALALPAPAGEPNYLKKGSVGKIKIESEKSDEVEILIRTVNDSAELKTKRHELGNRVWVDAGRHMLSVVCEFPTERGLTIKTGEVQVEAEDDREYRLVLDGPQEDDRTCFLRAEAA